MREKIISDIKNDVNDVLKKYIADDVKYIDTNKLISEVKYVLHFKHWFFNKNIEDDFRISITKYNDLNIQIKLKSGPLKNVFINFSLINSESKLNNFLIKEIKELDNLIQKYLMYSKRKQLIS
jgi:hypothetical protein